MNYRQKCFVIIFDRLICEQQERNLHQVIRVRRVVARHSVDDDPSTLDIMRTELPESQFLLVQVPHRPLFIDMRLLLRQADAGFAVRMILEELDVYVIHFCLFSIALAMRFRSRLSVILNAIMPIKITIAAMTFTSETSTEAQSDS